MAATADNQTDRCRIQNDLKILTERLSRINDSLARKVSLVLTLQETLPSAVLLAMRRRSTTLIVPSRAVQVAARNEYDQTIQETEGAYLKVIRCAVVTFRLTHSSQLPHTSLFRARADSGVIPDTVACAQA